MRVISRRSLREFWRVHPQAREPLSVWHRLIEHGRYADFHALRKTFGAADSVPPYTAFDVGGNKFRIVTVIHYDRKRLYVRHVFTHSEYDRWSARMRRTRTRTS